VLWITGAPGSGKTTLIKELVFGAKVQDSIDLNKWPLQKVGTRTQLVWHASADGRVAVAGAYAYPNSPLFPKHRRGTAPPNGGTDTLQPQSVGLLASLLRGELPACGRTPELVVVEACAKQKVGGPLVRDAMRAAARLHVYELHVPADEAVARLRARDHSHDGKGVKGESAEAVHAKYALQVQEMLEHVHTGEYAHVPELCRGCSAEELREHLSSSADGAAVMQSLSL